MTVVVDPSRRHARADRRRTPAGRCATPPRSPRRRRRRRKNSRCCASCMRARRARTARPRRRMTRRSERIDAGHASRSVFICDAVRTPIGRYGGALAKVRTDDLAAVPIKALMERNPKVDWATARRGLSSAAPTRPARTTATSPAWRCCWPACRIAVPGVTLNRLCASGPRRGRHRRARDPRRRDRVRHRRRRRVDDARAVRAWARRRKRFQRTRRDLRHHHRLALHQSADEGSNTASIPCRRPARTSPRNSRSRAPDQDAFALRSQQRAGKAIAAGYFAEEIVPVEVAGRQGRAGHGRQGRASAARHHARGAGQAEDAVPQSRHRHGRQCLGRQRRRRRADPRLGSGREARMA